MKYVLIVIVLAILGIGAYVVLGGGTNVLAPSETSQETSAPREPDIPPGTDSVPAGAVTTVTYTDAGFSPKIVSINVGDTVRFTNNSSNDLWVGADEHPTHTEYDGTTKDEHCPDGTSFDQCARSAPGTTWEYTFTKAGTFGYHNHSESDHAGTVIVK